MDNDNGIDLGKGIEKRQTISWVLLGGLLFLRLPFVLVVSHFVKSDWVHDSFEIGTYFLTACFIWIERKRLKEFHIGFLALLIIILFKPIQTLLLASGLPDDPLAFPNPASLIIWGISTILLFFLWKERSELPSFQWRNLRWIGIGLVVGIITSIILSYPMSLQIGVSSLKQLPELQEIFRNISFGFIYQLGYAAVAEEPLFRGFLWGKLRELKWKDSWINIFQAFLFSLGHIYYWRELPYSLWIIVPVNALIMGILARRSLSIATSMVFHAITNATTFFLANIVLYILNSG